MRFAVVFLLLAAPPLLAAPVPKVSPQRIDPAVVAAWQKAGASLQWTDADRWRVSTEFSPHGMNDPIPVFVFRSSPGVGFADLPSPDRTFAVYISESDLDRDGLKALARFDR